MTQVSQNPVHKDVYYSIRDDFLWVLSAIRTQDDSKAFFYDFFTKTERLMFAKRLGVALMIHKKYRYDDIRYILHVSSATISRVSDWLDKGGVGVKRVMDKLVKEERAEAFWKKVNKSLDNIMKLRK